MGDSSCPANTCRGLEAIMSDAGEKRISAVQFVFGEWHNAHPASKAAISGRGACHATLLLAIRLAAHSDTERRGSPAARCDRRRDFSRLEKGQCGTGFSVERPQVPPPS